MYYGTLVPNTYALKVSGIPLATRLEAGWIFTQPIFEQVWLLALLAILAVALAPRARWVLLTLPIAMVLYQIWIGGDGWYEWRFVAPTLPFLVVLAVLGGRDACREALRVRPSIGGISGTVGCLLCLGGVSIANDPFREAIDRRMTSTAYFQCNQARTARFLSAALRPSATIAVTWAGTLPYYAGFYTHDLLGKTDAHIAASAPHLLSEPTDVPRDGMPYRPGHAKYDLNYSVVQQSPDYAERLAWQEEDVSKQVSYLGTFVGHFRRGSTQVEWEYLLPQPWPSGPASTGAVLDVTDAKGDTVSELMGPVVEPFEKVLTRRRTWLSPQAPPNHWVKLELNVSPSESMRVLTLHTGHSGGFDIPRQVQVEVATDGKYHRLFRRRGAVVMSSPVPAGVEKIAIAMRVGYRGHVAVRGIRME